MRKLFACLIPLLLSKALLAQEWPRIEVTGFVSAGSYSGGGSSTSWSEYLKLYLEPESFLYAGHNSTLYRGNEAFSSGTRQELINFGGVFDLDGQNYLNAEYYHLGDNRGMRAHMFGAEFTHVLDEEFNLGLGANFSSYPGYNVQQIIPRVVWRPDPELSLNSRIYLTHSSQFGSYLGLVEKLSYRPGEDWEVQLGGAIGPTLNRIDNDTSTIYTQPQLQVGSLSLGLNYRPNADLKLQVGFERDFFQGYQVNYLSGGLNYRF
jgi:hypothetical protein